MKVFYALFFVLLLSACTTENYAPVNDAWSQKSEQKGQYVVKKGETLYAIAWRYDLDYRALAEANHLSSPYTLETGQVISLNVPPSQPKPVQKTMLVSKPVEQENGWKVKATPAVDVAPVAKEQAVHPASNVNSSSQSSQAQSVQKTTVSPQTVPEPIQVTPVSPQTVEKNQWIWPAKGTIIQKYSPAKGEKGIDIAGPMGEPIYAASSGKVAYAGNGLKGYGNLVIIKHSDEFLSAYAHNQKILVHEGQEVKAGQKIATMGNTESRKVMLHFEIREAGKSVDPLNYVKP